MIKTTSLFTLLFFSIALNAQSVPGLDENIPYLINFGPQAKLSFGDDDYKQSVFFIVPNTFKKPFYIRIFDPAVSGLHDELINTFDTKTKISFFGGDGIYSKIKGANSANLSETATGDLLFSKEFGNEKEYDNKWFSLGPFNPNEGEFSKELDGYVFKAFVQGVSGDDGNCYKYFLSSKTNENTPIIGSNAFTFEYTVRLNESSKEVSHLYPYVDNKVIKLKQNNFDLDGAVEIKIFSVVKVAEKGVTSGDNIWSTSIHKIEPKERESCMDFQVVNNRIGIAKNNNVVLSITNQYGEYLPFMAVPIGDYTPKRTVGVK